MPPASDILALMPVPAPPPMIGWPAATFARSRVRIWSRGKSAMTAFDRGRHENQVHEVDDAAINSLSFWQFDDELHRSRATWRHARLEQPKLKRLIGILGLAQRLFGPPLRQRIAGEERGRQQRHQ